MNARTAKQLRRLAYGPGRYVVEREGGRVKVARIHEPRGYRVHRKTGQIVAIGRRAEYQRLKRAA